MLKEIGYCLIIILLILSYLILFKDEYDNN